MAINFKCACTPRLVCGDCRNRARVDNDDYDLIWHHFDYSTYLDTKYNAVNEDDPHVEKAWGYWDDPTQIDDEIL